MLEKTKIVIRTGPKTLYETDFPTDNNKLDIEVVVSLKYVSNFWRTLDFSLITYEIELDL